MRKKIKICFILSHLPQGGAERQTINLLKYLCEIDFEITLLLYNKREVFYEEIYSLPITLVENERSYKNKIVRTISNFVFLKKYLCGSRYDILHTLLFHNGLWVRLAATKYYRGKIVYSIRNSLKDADPLYLFHEKTWIRKNIYVVTNSLKSKSEYLNLVGTEFSARVTNIYNGFSMEHFKCEYRPELHSEISIGTVGRQTAQKNQIQILQAVNSLKEEYSIHFTLIGDQSFEKSNELRSYVDKHNLNSIVTLMNSQKNIKKYYNKFNIFVLSSLYEGCPNVLFEAMLSKCLCIVSEGANSDHFIEDGINGLVYDGSNQMLEEKLKFAIQLMVAGRSDEIINNGQQYVLDNFSMNRMVKGYVKLYDNILEDNGGW